MFSAVVGAERRATDRQHLRERRTSAPGRCWVMNEVLLGKSIVAEASRCGEVVTKCSGKGQGLTHSHRTQAIGKTLIPSL